MVVARPSRREERRGIGGDSSAGAALPKFGLKILVRSCICMFEFAARFCDVACGEMMHGLTSIGRCARMGEGSAVAVVVAQVAVDRVVRVGVPGTFVTLASPLVVAPAGVRARSFASSRWRMCSWSMVDMVRGRPPLVAVPPPPVWTKEAGLLIEQSRWCGIDVRRECRRIVPSCTAGRIGGVDSRRPVTVLRGGVGSRTNVTRAEGTRRCTSG